jgi:hypothetical protein
MRARYSSLALEFFLRMGIRSAANRAGQKSKTQGGNGPGAGALALPLWAPGATCRQQQSSATNSALFASLRKGQTMQNSLLRILTVRRVLVRKEQHSTLCAATLLQHGRPQRRPRQRRPHHRTGRPKFFRPHSHVSCQRLAAHRRVVVCVLASLCGRGSQREGGCWCACGVGGCRLAGGQGYVATDTGVSIEVLATYDERGVAQWVQNLHPKLAPFAPLFEKHQIEGALFLRLTDEMLREMGIDCALARRCSISTQLR